MHRPWAHAGVRSGGAVSFRVCGLAWWPRRGARTARRPPMPFAPFLPQDPPLRPLLGAPTRFRAFL